MPGTNYTIVLYYSKDISPEMRLVLHLTILIITASCSPVSKGRITRHLRETETKFQDQTGLIVFDLEKQKEVFEYNSDKYFTPASNTKILTLLTALEILGDSIPGLKYLERADSLIIWGTGDPSFLNPVCYSNEIAYQFLKSRTRPIYLSFSNARTEPFGPGWAWDDYNDDYSQERSGLPIYGNSFQVLPLPDQTLVLPGYFNRYLRRGEPREKVEVKREFFSNHFTFYPGKRKSFQEFLVPFRGDPGLIRDLLADTLKKQIRLTDRPLSPETNTLFSVPTDSLYKVMMQKSDNFIAEQLLMICAGVLSDTLDGTIAIEWMQKNKFQNYPDKIVWRDGSGLSRYNLVTPRTILRAWQEINGKLPEARLFPLLATGGQPGTLAKWYKAESSYIFGKTGTLSNNFALSGFMKTKKGKTLIFAFMNANYVTQLNDVRKNTERILNLFYEHY